MDACVMFIFFDKDRDPATNELCCSTPDAYRFPEARPGCSYSAEKIIVPILGKTEQQHSLFAQHFPTACLIGSKKGKFPLCFFHGHA